MLVTKTGNLLSEEHQPVSCDSVDDLREILSGMSWQQLSAIKIEKDGMAIEGSGSTEDGFSVVFYESNTESVTPSDPTFDDMTDILTKFYEGDDAWRNNRAWEKPKYPQRKENTSPSRSGLLLKLIIFFAVGYAVAQLLNASG
ncbi:hypothetical protein [Alcanivorax sp.]|uniref:hypothetical protein n=1 Tax=Alcanivorax sp. TaxID=1872427 RepID=UPI0025C37753|nr:hypothetical protein [Alcanivorax sp.]